MYLLWGLEAVDLGKGTLLSMPSALRGLLQFLENRVFCGCLFGLHSLAKLYVLFRIFDFLFGHGVEIRFLIFCILFAFIALQEVLIKR